jgi:endonuclease/exonuclease/phosphatase family metal-dependent hydrolase
MGISGWEAMVMVTISPVFLAIGALRRIVVRNTRFVHALSLVGMLAYTIKSPEYRLITVGLGVFLGCLAWTATFYGERSQPHRLEARTTAFALGLLLSSLAKYAFWTNNPAWPIMHGPNGGWNKTILAVAVLSALRSPPVASSRGGELPAPGPQKGSPILAACGLAGLLFAMHSLLSDSSTMILWVWEGYPVRGPLAVPHGTWTMAAMGAGLAIGLYYPAFSRSWMFYCLGSAGAAILTCYSHWFGYYGALAMTVYIMAVTPSIISSAARHNPAVTFGLGFFVYNLMVLFHVWVVAYAFVPGGPLFREHTDWVMLSMMLQIGNGVYAAQAAFSTPAAGKARAKPTNPATRKQRSYYIYVLLVIELLSASVSYLRFPSYNYTPYHPEQKLVTAGIWTIHFSLDNDMWSSERRMRDAIKELELDVVGLLESDLQRIIMGNRDTTQFLAEDLGMYVDYGPGPNKHTWGSALLSKFPIVNSTHHLLPSPVGELAPAIHATLDMYGTLVDVFVFHSGQEEDPEDRRQQTQYLSKLMGSSPRPSILLSYLVTKPKEGNYNTYVSELSGMRDIDHTDWDRWCEYILYKGLRRTGYARVSRGTITDTEIQVGKFVVGEPEGTDNYLPEENVPEGLRFPAMFRGEGVRGHRYHVFTEPRYYQ